MDLKSCSLLTAVGRSEKIALPRPKGRKRVHWANAGIEIDSGRLRGRLTADGVVAAFLGVPYAAPPVGALRWRPPAAVAAWAGVRPADRFAPRAVQPERAPNAIGNFGPEPESEDCLYLNLWTAAQDPAERRPVMVWFHGGAFYLGSGALPLFHGEGLARHGVVLVTVNYRLGRLGFLAHPELSREAADHSSGNYGLRDQIAALEWVQRNIAAFGGDPSRVTIFGQSAGSISVCCHMVAPRAKGLFHRAIGQSGAALGPVGATAGNGDMMQSLDQAERAGAALVRALGVSSIEALRQWPARAVQLARPGADAAESTVQDPSQAASGAFDTAWPVVDGRLLPEAGFSLFRQGRQNDVPLLTGTNANEGATMPSLPQRDAFRAHAQAVYGAMAERLLRLYPAASDDEARIASRTVLADRAFVWQNWTWARLQAMTGGAPVFYYRFSRVPPIPAEMRYFENPASEFGAFHGAEIPYVYRNLAVRPWPWQAQDRALSDQISTYWVNFAATGDPNGVGLPQWPAFTTTLPQALEFGERITVVPVPLRERLDFWDDYFASLRG